MKSLFLIGGFLGFAIGITFSLVQRESLQACLWHGCLAAFLAGVLLPCLGRVWGTKNPADATSDAQDALDPLLSTSSNPNTSKS
jgi:hypothetical protein